MLFVTWYMLLLLSVILAVAGVLIYKKAQKHAEVRLRKEEFLTYKRLSNLTQSMLRFSNLKSLLTLITHNLVKIMKVELAAVYLKDEQDNSYILMSSSGICNTPTKQNKVTEDSPLIKDILLRKAPVSFEESHTKDVQFGLNKAKATVIVPAFKGDELYGFLMLGPRKDSRIFTQEDLNFLLLLANQTILTIENAKLIEKDKNLLAEKSRRDALADMAPGVAHQFDNRLQSISLVAETRILLNEQQDLEKLSRDELISLIKQSQDDLSSIARDAIKGKEISNAVKNKGKANLTLEKQQLLPIFQGAVNRLKISRTEETLQGAAEPEVAIETDQNLPELLLKQSQADDIFYNLLDNARDAIIRKYVCIKDGMFPKEETSYKGRIVIAAEKKGDYIIVTVTDNGIGMKEKELRRLFVPWFTTKATSVKGAGMGLNSIQAVIEDHKGKISVESEYGKGSTFAIRFPIPGQ